MLGFDLFPYFKLCKVAEVGIILEIYFCYVESLLFLPAGFSALDLPQLFILAITADVFTINIFQSLPFELGFVHNRSCSSLILSEVMNILLHLKYSRVHLLPYPSIH